MKIELLLCAVLAGGALAQSSEAESEDPFAVPDPSAPVARPDPSPQVLTTIEFIELSQVDSNRLLYQERLVKNGDKLREELQKLLDEGKAVMAETMLVSGRSGQKSTVESVREMIYPTEHEPNNGPPSLLPERTVPKPQVPIFGTPWAGILPTAFETRNTGGTLEVEPNLWTDSRTIELKILPEIVLFTGLEVHQRSKDLLGNEYTTSTPIFYSMRTSTSLTSLDGESRLVAVLSPRGKDGPPDPTRKMLVIARCDLSPVRKEE